ncbi:MAG: S49 family peptidase [Planctomycetes bacterium]|nr:S49 family peptidase [Planctomycetota bacterium]
MLGKNLVLACIASGLSAVSYAADNAKVAWLEISGAPSERPHELAWLVGSADHPTLREVIEGIDEIAHDGDCRGVVIRLKDAELSASQVEEIGAAIKRVREAGKKVHVFAEGYAATDLMLGSYADEIIAQRGGEVTLPGIYMEEMFLADTLAWAGVKADFVQVGDYKGASEMFARSGPSKEWDSNISQLLDSMYQHMREPIKQGRKLDDAKLDAAMNEAWMADAADAKRVGLIDAEADLPALSDHLKAAYNGEVEFDKRELGDAGTMTPDASNPFAMMAALSKQPKNKPTGPTIAVLHIDGEIIDGESKSGFSGGGSVGSRTIRNALEDILAESNIKGMIVRIDSPGGSAIASEVIWQGVRRVAAAKPVWVSVGGMAASGGYYIAVAGDKIYVNPSSIVGSIGVVGGKMSLKGLFDKFNVHVVGRGRGPRAGMFSSTSPWSVEDANLVRQKMTATYDQFTKRVTAGRSGIDLKTTAEGRLFTGDKAIAMKMADKIGGLDDAINDMAESLKIDEYDVMDYPGPRALGEVIQDTLGGLMAAPQIKSPAPTPVGAQVRDVVREVVGERAWKQLAPQVRAFMLMRDEPVLLTSPHAIIWK